VRGVAIGRAIEVAFAHKQWVKAEVSRNVAQQGFGNDHALRPTKASKRGVALLVCFAAVRIDANVL
jgi:hypothetical protein